LEAAFAAGSHDAGCQFAERTRVSNHCVGQRRAFLNAGVNIFKHCRQILIGRLLAKHFDRTQKWYPAAQQGG